MALSRQQISAIAHTEHPIACPFSDSRVDQLLKFLPQTGAVLDVGCGGGEWIARLVASSPALHVTGIDTSETAIARARRLLAHNSRTVKLLVQDAEGYMDSSKSRHDAVLCNGSTHALGGLACALRALRGMLARDGVLLISDGYWQQPPSETACGALDAKPEDFRSLDDTVALAESAGYRPLHVAPSSQEEWDDYERKWCDTLEGYVEAHPDLTEVDRTLITATVQSHRESYWNGYRGTLGFVAMVLEAETPEN